jgi:hypothetical protein
MDIPRDPRRLDDGTAPAKAHWWPWHGTAMLSCPNGHIASLRDHEIAVDGTVTPSVVCPWDGCNFHQSLRLLEWGAPAARAEK